MKLNRSEGGGKKLYTGFFSGKVVSVNPTKEELSTLIGYDLRDDATDIVYEGKTDKDEDYVSLSFWLSTEGENPKFFNARFRLVDKTVFSEKTGKTQFVNQTAGSTWVDDEANLPDWFTHFQDKDKKNIADRIWTSAIQGEANLYTFMRAWLSKVEWYDYDKMMKYGGEPTNCLIDKARMFRNLEMYVDEEYRYLIKAQGIYEAETDRDEKAKLLKNIMTGNVVCLATVYITEKEGETKMYQNLYSEFLNSFQWKKINLAITTNNWMTDDKMKKFYEQIIGEYGIKDAYTLGLLEEFDADKHQQSSGETFTPPEDGKAVDTTY